MGEPTPAPPRYDMDGLLGLAAVLVLVAAFGLGPWTAGAVGLPMALVVIGYRLTQSLIARPQGPWVANVIGAVTGGVRTMYPVLIPVLLAILVIGVVRFPIDQIGMLSVQAAAASVQALPLVVPEPVLAPDGSQPLTPLWPVSVGAQAGLVWIGVSVCAYRLGGARMVYIAAFAMGAIAIGAGALAGQNHGLSLAVLAPLWLWSLAFGALLVALDPLYWQHTLLASISREILTVIGAAIIAGAVFLSAGVTPQATPSTLLSVLGTTLILFARGAPTLGHLFSNPLSRMIGQGAYAAFVLHVPVLWLLNAEAIALDRLVTVAVIVLVLAVGALIHRFWEQPVSRWTQAAPSAWLAVLSGTLVTCLFAIAILAAAMDVFG